MSYRFMRVIVMFDLPTDTAFERKNYRNFRKFLIKNGFMMMQESVYVKICLNMHAVEKVKQNIVKNKTKKGIIQVLSVTERQFADIDLIVGEQNGDFLDNDERMVVI